MKALDRIDKKELRNLLGKGWLTHDGLWFYHTCRELGIERANELNRAAIKSLAPIEVQRVKKVLGISKEKFDTFDELTAFMLAALELTLPDSVFRKANFRATSNGMIHWRWDHEQCFAYKGMKRIGTIDKYRCGVMYRIECWLDALGITDSMHPAIEGCLMHETGNCKGKIRVVLPD